jgi:IS30 family transposase
MGGDTERTPHLEAARNSGIGGALSASELRFFAAAPGHRVSHETIYRTLFIHARGALKKELLQHLRRTLHASVAASHPEDRHSRADRRALSISERPASAEDRAVSGHWDGDLMFGAHARLAKIAAVATGS